MDRGIGAAAAFGLAECDAIVAGVRAAELALTRARVSGVLRLFEDDRHRFDADRKLESLAAYAELRRALFARHGGLPAAPLIAAGYSAEQAARIDALIDALAAGSEL